MADPTPTPAPIETPAAPATPAAPSGAEALFGADGKGATPSAPAVDPAPAADPAPAVLLSADPPADPAAPILEVPPEGEVAPKAEAIDPASYTFTLPEGFIEDPVAMTAARTALAEAGVDPTKAQSLFDLYISGQQASLAAAAASIAAQSSDWLAASNQLPEFQGATRETSLTTIRRLFDTYGNPEVLKVFAQTGVGNNPDVVSMYLKIAKALDEGGPTTPGRPPAPNGGRPPRGPSALYPDNPTT